MARSSVTIRITNTAAREVEFVLEPWGEIYPMPSHTTYEVTSSPASAEGLEVEFASDAITVYAAPESTVSVTHEGRELSDASEPRTKTPRVRRRASAIAKA